MPLRKKPLPRKRTFRKNVKEERSELNPAKFKDHIEVIGKTVLGVVAFCYAVGILVESLYLGSFGVYHVSIFRFTYVFAGAWAILIFIIPLFPLIMVAYSVNSFFRSRSRPKFAEIVIVIGGVVLLFYLEYTLFTVIEIRDIFSLLILLDVTVFLTTLILFEARKDYTISAQIMKILCGLITISVFVIFLVYFAQFIFPQISARVGGGKPLTVQLLLEANKQNASMIQKNFDLCESDKAKIRHQRKCS